MVGVDHRHMRVDGDDRAAATLEREVGLVELLTAGERRTLGLGAPDELLLLAERLPVPHLDRHVDPARREVGATHQPVGGRVVLGGDPDVLVQGGDSSGVVQHPPTGREATSHRLGGVSCGTWPLVRAGQRVAVPSV